MRSLTRLLLWLGLSFAPFGLATEPLEYEGALYHLHRVPVTAQPKLDLRWLDSSGKPLSDFDGLQKQLAREGKKIVFATNGGIYENGPKRCGLTINDSKSRCL